MTPEEEKTARDALRAIPALAGYSGPIERLGGLTNKVYRVGDHVLRIPGQGTEEYINRENEAVSAGVAAKAGVSPAVIHADPKTGVMVTVLVPDAVTMSPDGFRSRKGSPARAGQVFRKLHTSGGTFPFRFELFAMIDDYLKVLATKDVELPEGYHDVVREADAVRAALARAPLPLVPCHCDPLCENFIDDGTRMWVVDWEYSGMNDPHWDLGDLSVEAGMDEGQESELLRGYFGRDPTPAERGRVVIYKAMCDLLWTLWGVIQHVNGNPADDFWAYATGRFERCRALMDRPDYQAHLDAILAG